MTLLARPFAGYGGILSTLAITDIPVSRYSVARCEQVLSSNLVAQRRSWYSDLPSCSSSNNSSSNSCVDLVAREAHWYETIFVELESFVAAVRYCQAPIPISETSHMHSASLSWEIHTFMGDASNASTVRSAKAFASFIMSWIDIPKVSATSADATDANNPDVAAAGDLDESLWVYPELFIVPEHMDGAAAVKLYEDIYESIGAEHWRHKHDAMVPNNRK